MSGYDSVIRNKSRVHKIVTDGADVAELGRRYPVSST